MRLEFIDGIPHWVEGDTALPIMAGGFDLGAPHGEFGPFQSEAVGGGGGGITFRPVEGLPGALQAFLADGTPARDEAGNAVIVAASDFLAAASGAGAPAFSGTAAGIELQGAQQRLTQAQADLGALERARLQARTDLERQRIADRAALARQKVADAAAKVRQLISTTGAGVTAQLGEEGAFRRGLLGEVGAGARSELEQATARRGQSITAILDTARNLNDLSSRPSDFVRLAANAQGIQPVGTTPTDTFRTQQQEFFQNQLSAANAAPRSFADLFRQTREGVGGFGTPSTFADLFSRARRRIGGFQFGGRPQEESGIIEMRRGGDGSFERAAIVGENQRPELVFGATEVIPNLSASEVRLLREGGVVGAEHGAIHEDPLGLPEPEPEPNVFDFPVLRPDAGRQPLFSGGLTRAGAGGVGAVTRAPALNPLDFSFSRFANLAPFEQQLAFGRFGETIVDPETGRIQRAGIDPETVFELIRRSSLFGNTPGRSRFG